MRLIRYLRGLSPLGLLALVLAIASLVPAAIGLAVLVIIQPSMGTVATLLVFVLLVGLCGAIMKGMAGKKQRR